MQTLFGHTQLAENWVRNIFILTFMTFSAPTSWLPLGFKTFLPSNFYMVIFIFYKCAFIVVPIVFLAMDLFLVMDPTCLTLLRGCLKTSYVEAVLDWPHSIKLKVEDRNKFVVVAIGTKASLLKTTKFHSIEYFAKRSTFCSQRLDQTQDRIALISLFCLGRDC